MDAQAIAEALNGRRYGKGYRSACPVCGGSDKSTKFTMTDASDRVLVHCHAGCSFADISTELRNRGLWPDAATEQKQTFQKMKHQKAVEYAETVKMISDSAIERGDELSEQDRETIEKADLTISGSVAVTQRMDTVKSEPIQWLWPSRIALGKVTLIAGDPGLGKSIITVTLAAHVTLGTQWPVDRSECPQGSVIILSAEDDPGDTIRPRLDAAGADVNRVHNLTMIRDVDNDGNLKDRSFNLACDIDALDRLLNKLPDCRLITIDPISAYLGRTDSHNNADIRALLMPLAAMASKHKVAIVVVTHLNKSAQANALYRASGSLAFVAAARAVFAVVKDPDEPDRRLFLPIKNNLGDDRTGYAYHIATADNDAPVIQWEPEPVEVTLEEMADTVTDRKQRPVEQVKTWLQDALSDGEVLQKDIRHQADDEGYSWRTVQRAKKDMGIISSKHRFDGQWTWRLPEVGQDLRYLSKVATDEECQLPPAHKVAHFSENGTLGSTKDAKQSEERQFDNREQVAHFANGSCPRCDGEGCDFCGI